MFRTQRHIIYVHPFEDLSSKVDVGYIHGAMKSGMKIECDVHIGRMSRLNDNDIQTN